MTTITASMTRHPVATYVALTFAFSWGGVLIVVGPGGFPATPEQLRTLLPVAVLAMIAGPSIAGILLTALIDGKAGLREYRGRLLNRRVDARWYAAALLIAPLLMIVVSLALSLFASEFLPGVFVSDDKTTLVLSGLGIGLGAGIFEELGWTGFAIPRLRRRHGVVTTGLIVGLVWGAWHVLVLLWASGSVSGALAFTSYMLDPFLFLATFRVFMVWVYDRTESLLVAMLMHVSLTASVRIIGAPGIAGLPLLTFDLAWFAALWTLITLIAIARPLSGQPLRNRVA